MKVLHVEAGMHLYGGAQQVLYIMQGLAGLGVSNVLACPTGSEISEQAGHCATVRSVSMKGDLDVGQVWRLIKLIKQEKIDLVHLHSRRGADLLGGIAARLSGVPCVLSRRVDNPEPAWVVQIKYRLYDRVITISEAIRTVLISQGVAEKKVVCVRSAVDAAPYRHGCERQKFKQEFCIKDKNIVIGMMAQFIPRKGHRYVLQALPAVLKEYQNLSVLFFGKGPLVDQVKDEIKELGLQNVVSIAGFRTDLDKWLCCLDLLVHPAEMEGLGVSLLQAAAAGVPIIGSRAGGIPEVVHDGDNGLLIEPGDVDELGEAILALLSDTHLRQEMGLRGKQMISKLFSIKAMASGNFDVYTQVLSETK